MEIYSINKNEVKKMINKKDLKILVELRKNGRAKLTDISKNTGIPISTIYDRLQNKPSGYIKKHACLVNFDRLGFNTRAQICIKCNKNSKKELKEFLSIHQNVNSLHKINNGYDFMIEAVFRNIKDMEEFKENIEEQYSIKSSQVYYIIEDIIRENFFNNEIHLNLLSQT